MPFFSRPEVVPKGRPHVPQLFRDSGQRRHLEALRRNTEAMREVAKHLAFQTEKLTTYHAESQRLEVRTSTPTGAAEKRDTKPTGTMWLQRLEASHRRDLLEVHGDISQKELDGMMAELFSLSAEEIRTRLLEIAEPRQVPPTVRTIQRAVRKTEPWMHHRDTSDRPDRLTRQEGGRSQNEIDADEWLRSAGENPNHVSFTPKK